MNTEQNPAPTPRTDAVATDTEYREDVTGCSEAISTVPADFARTLERELAEARDSIVLQTDAITQLRAEVERMKETNQRLNRRCQMAEKATPDYQKIIAIPPDGDGVRFVQGSLGRAFLVLACHKQEEELIQLRAALAAAKEDTERLDWLERNGSLPKIWMSTLERRAGEGISWDIRAAIDAARGAKP